MGREKRRRASSVRTDETSQVGQAYLAIEELIATLKLAPGRVLSEKMLADMLGLGRTPVREALQQLAREGLVAILPQRGVVVSEMDVGKQLKMLEVRRVVERYVVGAAARRATAEERLRFKELQLRMERAARHRDGTGFLALDREFNNAL